MILTLTLDQFQTVWFGLNQFGLSLSLVWEILNGLVWGLAKSGLNQTEPNFPNTNPDT
jgi:hypothetical protein